MAAAAFGLLGQVTTGDIQTSGTSTIRNFIQNGFPVGRIGLLFLTGLLPLPIPPFTSLGEYGVNLLAGGSPVMAGFKAITQIAFTVAHNYIKGFYPALWPIVWLTRFSPWFVFDILQTMSPAFTKDGYKIPFMKPATGREPIAAKGGQGKIDMITVPVIIGILSLGAYTLLQSLPASITGSAKPILDIIVMVIGGASALSLGGIGGMTVIPQILEGLKKSGGELKEVIQTAPGPSGPASGPAVQQGGAHIGSQMPPLREVAGHMLGPSEKGDPAPYFSNILSGGGRENAPTAVESLFFWLTLMIVAGGGMALAATRS
jgi:hypothetical protein